MVCRLRKFINGLKQAPRAWYAKMDSFLLLAGFTRCHSYLNAYILSYGGGPFPHMMPSSSHFILLYLSLFLEGGFPIWFSLFLYFMRDCIASILHLQFVHGYLTWPSGRDPSCFII